MARRNRRHGSHQHAVTFSILVRGSDGSFGAAIASSSPAVAARCLTLLDGVGAVSSQNITDPRLGGTIMSLLTQGVPAAQAIHDVALAEETAEYRQLLAIDSNGATGIHSGKFTLGVWGTATAPSVVAAGNMLASENVPQAMVDAFVGSEGELEQRLLAALDGALAAGGEAGPIHSAAISVVTTVGWRVTDLRVDWDDAPIERLRALLSVWLPQRDDYVSRGLAPHTSPAYGVPGNE
jgi:uncharacterized Ntn-hydrolase superfamily protein